MKQTWDRVLPRTPFPDPTPEDPAVIRVTRLNGEHFALNPDLIERVEGHPDTVVTLVGDTKYVVAESVDAVLREIRDYRASVQAVAFQMDRGNYRPASPAPDEDDDSSSVVPFPTREER
ncbi:MAG: flbD [Modestobacter sp.]|jgi:flagellar protein FlbD|nr:flbD [Modestobacter sp.]MCW2677019.1 flbD [Modestobacter sp.]